MFLIGRPLGGVRLGTSLNASGQRRAGALRTIPVQPSHDGTHTLRKLDARCHQDPKYTQLGSLEVTRGLRVADLPVTGCARRITGSITAQQQRAADNAQAAAAQSRATPSSGCRCDGRRNQPVQGGPSRNRVAHWYRMQYL
eukprot:scaffold1919_cov394-Prasinococcus_capsulatus_cf.AAC.5